MPRLSLHLPPPTTPWTRTSNILFDKLLPTLKDSELRILLVLIRQTAGWNREGRPLTITYRTLQKRTGRRSAALAAALKSLERRGLIHTTRSYPTDQARFPKEIPSKNEQQYKDN